MSHLTQYKSFRRQSSQPRMWLVKKLVFLTNWY